MDNQDNIEVLVIEWLQSITDSEYPVSGDIPKERPASFITVDRTGGNREAMVLDRAEILIEVYNKESRVAASQRANRIADLVPQLAAWNENITRGRVNSVVNLPDLTAGFQRYQVYCDVYFRRTE
jgi:hypothetical protein